MHRYDIVIVTPALGEANNGNWQTARRWAGLLGTAYRVRVVAAWEQGDEHLMIALHARRSAPSMQRWRARRPAAPLVLALTGTDLYGDIVDNAEAQAALHAADRLVVLNDLGPRALPVELRARTQVVLQSCAARAPVRKTGRHLRALMVGHLREEKSPGTYFAAARLLAARDDILLDHVGAALDPALGARATALMAACPNYRWVGAISHAAARKRIQAAHVLVHPSRIEGGAHVITEAIRSGTPVLASRIEGNAGLLGLDYRGYFPAGDAAALATWLQRLRDEPAILDALQVQSAARAERFDPRHERATLQALVASLLPPASAP